MGSLGMHAMADTRRDNLSSNINFAWRDSRVEIWVPTGRVLCCRRGYITSPVPSTVWHS